MSVRRCSSVIPHSNSVGLALGFKLKEGSEEGRELGEATLGAELKEGSMEGGKVGEVDKEGGTLGKVDGNFEGTGVGTGVGTSVGKGVGTSVGKGVGLPVGLSETIGVLDGLFEVPIGGLEGSIDMVGMGETGAILVGTVEVVGDPVGKSVGEFVLGGRLMKVV